MSRQNDYGLRQNKQSKNIPTRLSVLSLLFLFLSFIFCVLTTQNLANEFNYHESLGQPIFGKIYQPFAWVSWYLQFNDQHQEVLYSALRRNLLIVLFIFAIITFIIISTRYQTGDKHPDLHGSARKANFKDIQTMDILDNEGAAIGGFIHKKRTHYLWHDGPEHILAFAPTRSGKGVGLVIPTLLSWPHSMVVYDLKKENWSVSAKWRKDYANNHVLRFEPACNDGSATRFNPLEEIRINTDHDVADAQNISTMIMDDTGKGLQDYWAQAGFDFLTGLILHVVYSAHQNNRTASIPDLAFIISDPDNDISDTLEIMIHTIHKDNAVHPAVAQSARTMVNKADREMSGVLGHVISKLSLYRDPIVSKNISRSDFKIRDLMNNEKPVSLYICVGATDKDRMRPLTRLVFSMILSGLTQDHDFEDGAPKQNYKHRCQILFDEFPSVGKLDVFQESLAYLAGYGIKCFLIAQDLSQLRSSYGRDESIMSNCHVRIAYAPNKMETAEEISKMTGITTITKKNVSNTKRPDGVFASNNQTISYQEQQRYLFTADEVMRIKGIHSVKGETVPGDMLIFIAGQPVIYGTQILYFKDPVFMARAKLGAPRMSDRIIDSSDKSQSFEGKSFAEKFEQRHTSVLGQ